LRPAGTLFVSATGLAALAAGGGGVAAFRGVGLGAVLGAAAGGGATSAAGFMALGAVLLRASGGGAGAADSRLFAAPGADGPLLDKAPDSDLTGLEGCAPSLACLRIAMLFDPPFPQLMVPVAIALNQLRNTKSKFPQGIRDGRKGGDSQRAG
jgi:hypothetical protein